MRPTDFGVDVDALPKLVLNEERGRALLAELNDVKAFREYIDMGKRVFLQHYLADHLDVKEADFSEPRRSKYIKRTDALMKDHELVWMSISRLVDRHVFLLVTAHASIMDNVLDADDMEYVKCNAYTNTFDVAVSGALDGLDIAKVLYHRIKRGPTLAGTLDNTVRAAQTADSDILRYGNVVRKVIKDFVHDKASNGPTTDEGD